MITTITMQTPIAIQPSSGVEEVIQNVRFLLKTIKGTCPLYRQFGLPINIVDKPINTAQALIVAEVARAIQRFEPRAKLRSILWEESDVENGELNPLVTIEVNA